MRNRIANVLGVFGLILGLAFGITAADAAVNAQSAQAASEVVYNDSPTYSVGVVISSGTTLSVAPGKASFRSDIVKVKLWSWQCGKVRINNGSEWSYLGSYAGGTMSVRDGWSVHVVTWKASSTGKCFG